MRDARAILVPPLILLAGWLPPDSAARADASLTLVRHFTRVAITNPVDLVTP